MPPKKRTERLSPESVSALERAFLLVVEALGVSLEEILLQVDEDPYALARAIRGADWEEDIAAPVRKAYEVGALREYNKKFRAVAVKHALLQFIDGEGNTPFAKAHVSFEGTRLIKSIDASVREGLIQAINEGFEELVNPRQVARTVVKRKIVGLSPRLATAVQKRAKLLRAKGLPETQIEKETERYAKKLVRYRAQMIARSEMISAANQGHLEAWKVGIDQGMIAKNAKKQWIAGIGERTCPICLELHGQKRFIHSPFHSKVLGRDLMRPTAHPSCRCTMILVK